MSYKDVLLISTDYVKTYTHISDNIDDSYILPAMVLAQRQYLEEILGTQLTRKLQKLVDENLVYNPENEKYAALLDDYVQDYLACMTISEMSTTLAFKLNNFGVTRTDDEKMYNVSFDEVFKLRDFYRKKADYFGYRMQRFILANYEYYPELATYKSIADLQVNLYSAASCPIWLGGERGKSLFGEPSLKDLYNFPSKNN